MVPNCTPIHGVQVLLSAMSLPTLGTIGHLRLCRLAGAVKWHHAATLTCISLITGEVECLSRLKQPITDWISETVTGLFRFSPFPVSFDISIFPENCPVHLFSNSLVVVFTLFILILLICVFSLFFISLAGGLLI